MARCPCGILDGRVLFDTTENHSKKISTQQAAKQDQESPYLHLFIHSFIHHTTMGGKVRIVQIKLRGTASLRGGDTVRGLVILENVSKRVIPCEASVQLIGQAHAEFEKSSTQFISASHDGPRTATTYHFTGVNVIQNTIDHIWDHPSDSPTQQQHHQNSSNESTTSSQNIHSKEPPTQAQHVEIDASQKDSNSQPVRQRSLLSLLGKNASWRSHQSSNSNSTTSASQTPLRNARSLFQKHKNKPNNNNNNNPHKSSNNNKKKYIHVPPGKSFEVPFAFPLKPDAPGSVHEGYLENGCHLQYFVQATIREAGRWGRPQRLKHSVTVQPSGPKIRSNVSELLQPVEISLHQQRLYKHFGAKNPRTSGSGFLARTTSRFFFSKSFVTNDQADDDDDDAVPGTVSLRLQLDRRAYAPGQHINLTGSYVDNDTTEHQWVFMGVRMHLHLHGLGQDGAIVGQQRHTKHRDYCFVHEQLAPGMRKELHRYPLPITMLPSFDGSGLSPRNQHASMKWSYELFLWTGDPSKAGLDTASPDVLMDGTQINVGAPVSSHRGGTTTDGTTNGAACATPAESSTMSIQGGLSTTTAFFGSTIHHHARHRSPMAEVKVPVLICSEAPPVYLPSWAKNKEAYIRPLDPLEQHSQKSLWDIFEIAEEDNDEDDNNNTTHPSSKTEASTTANTTPALLHHLYPPAPKRQRRSSMVKNPFRFSSMNNDGRHQSSRKILIRMGERREDGD